MSSSQLPIMADRGQCSLSVTATASPQNVNDTLCLRMFIQDIHRNSPDGLHLVVVRSEKALHEGKKGCVGYMYYSGEAMAQKIREGAPGFHGLWEDLQKAVKTPTERFVVINYLKDDRTIHMVLPEETVNLMAMARDDRAEHMWRAGCVEVFGKIVCDNRCAGCDAVMASKHRCSRCRAVKYCGVECQKAHWAEHKKVCGSGNT